VPDNESSAKIDTAIAEAIRQFEQRIKALDAEVERINANNDPASITEAAEAVRQFIKDLDAAVQRIREARREH
jgi:predicted component of type VI protein secretion system